MVLMSLLKEKQISVYQCAKESHVPYTTLSDMVKGKTRIEKCTAETIYKLARTLNVTMETLLTECCREDENAPNLRDFEIMKLMSGGCYKKDLSDIIGILSEQKRMGEPLSCQQIDCAVRNLYGGWDNISEYAIQVLKAALDSESLTELFMKQEQEEALSKQAVLRVRKYEKEKVNESHVDVIIQRALSRKKKDRDVR